MQIESKVLVEKKPLKIVDNNENFFLFKKKLISIRSNSQNKTIIENYQ